jgi:hypothetical protein
MAALFRRKPKPSLTFADPTDASYAGFPPVVGAGDAGTNPAAGVGDAPTVGSPPVGATPDPNNPDHFLYGGKGGGDEQNGGFAQGVYDKSGAFLGYNYTIYKDGQASNYGVDFGGTLPPADSTGGLNVSGIENGLSPTGQPIGGDTSYGGFPAPAVPSPRDPYEPASATDANPTDLKPIDGHPGQFTDGRAKGGGDPTTNFSETYRVYDQSGKYLGENMTIVKDGVKSDYGYSFGTSIPSSVDFSDGSSFQAQPPTPGGSSEQTYYQHNEIPYGQIVRSGQRAQDASVDYSNPAKPISTKIEVKDGYMDTFSASDNGSSDTSYAAFPAPGGDVSYGGFPTGGDTSYGGFPPAGGSSGEGSTTTSTDFYTNGSAWKQADLGSALDLSKSISQLEPHGMGLMMRDSEDGKSLVIQMTDGTYQSVDKGTGQVTSVGTWGDGKGGGVSDFGVGNETPGIGVGPVGGDTSYAGFPTGKDGSPYGGATYAGFPSPTAPVATTPTAPTITIDNNGSLANQPVVSPPAAPTSSPTAPVTPSGPTLPASDPLTSPPPNLGGFEPAPFRPGRGTGTHTFME